MAAVSLSSQYYNFGQTLRATPAMEEGVSDHVCTLTEIVALMAIRLQGTIAAGPVL